MNKKKTNLKDELEDLNNRINKFESKDTNNIKHKKMILSNFYKNKICLMTALNYKKNEIVNTFTDYVENCDFKLSYSDLIDLYSIAILLNLSMNDINTINKNEQIDDDLTFILKSILQGKSYDIDSNNVKFSNYSIYLDILNMDKDQATETLIDFIENKWYDTMKDVSWYNSPDDYKKTNWLAAVIIKVKGLPKNKFKKYSCIPVNLI